MLSALLDAGLLVSSGIGCCWLLLLALRLVFGEKRWSAAGDALFALAMDRVFSRQIRERLDDTKARLFADLKTQLSADESLRQDSALNMLEIGVGTGANLEFYPAGSRLTCVDANPAFESYFRERCGAAASHLRPPLRFLVADAGDMPAVASDSMDAVVATLLFCNMERAAPVLSEVKRVLAPDGRFYFIEHVAAREGTWRRTFQELFTSSGLSQFFCHGCRPNSQPLQAIQEAGFKSVEWSSEFLKPPGQTYYSIFNPVLFGVATK